jgi:nitrogen fixation protein FixH
MVFVLIGLNFCIVGFTVYASSRRASSHAVEPDYDRKALNWNQSAQQTAHNKELGWSCQLVDIGRASIAASLTDQTGQAISGVQVSLEAFHHAHAGNRIQADLREVDGLYRAPIVIDKPGLWDFRFTARKGHETFTASTTRMVMEGGS